VLAFEWINGTPLRTWLQQHPFQSHKRVVLEFFLRLCDAVSHAHSRGIIHRDLKPSNVLVDSKGQPHVLDFGIAKVLPDPEAASTSDSLALLTQTGDLLGTPAYAAPEQLLERSQRVDARADVYSLGVLLYQFLTGRNPFEQYQSVAALLEAVSRRSVPPPSRFSRAGRDLDTIVGKATQNEPQDRYRSVDELATDVRLALTGQPILTSRRPFWAILWQTARRHRLAAALSVLLLIVLLSFSVVVAWQAFRLAREKQSAEQSADKAQAMLDFIRQDLLTPMHPQLYRRDFTLREAIDRAQPGLAKRFPGQPGVVANLQRLFSAVYNHLGNYGQAVTLARAAYEASADRTQERLDARLLWSAALAQQGETEVSGQLLRQNLDDLQHMEDAHPQYRVSTLLQLGQILTRPERRQEAESVLRQSLELATEGGLSALVRCEVEISLAHNLTLQGRLKEAQECLQGALDLCVEEGLEETPTYVEALTVKADLHQKVGELQQAEELLREALGILEECFPEEHPETAYLQGNLGAVLAAQWRTSEALPLTEQAVARLRRQPATPHLASALMHLGDQLLVAGQLRRAREIATEALAEMEANFGVESLGATRAAENLGAVYMALKDYEESAALFESALSRVEALPDSENRYRFRILVQLADCEARAGHQDLALERLEEALDEAIYRLPELVVGQNGWLRRLATLWGRWYPQTAAVAAWLQERKSEPGNLSELQVWELALCWMSEDLEALAELLEELGDPLGTSAELAAVRAVLLANR
jgi:tetratricopeptide (TPR) repeat protein